jgi:hypothetical protein
MIDAKTFPLGRLVEVRAGFPFRGAIKATPDGGTLVIQMKDIDPEAGIAWHTAVCAQLRGRRQPDWLQPGDVLFIPKGTRFYAVCVDAPSGPAVCGPHFFHLRAKPGAPVLPAFLAWQINQPPFQRQLRQAAEGSSQQSIRRPLLEALGVSIPDRANQQRIIALAELARRERGALQQLIRNREQQLHALAGELARAAYSRTSPERTTIPA